MIKISAHISRKNPGPENFSSEQFSAGMDVKVSDADAPEKIKARIREIYSLLDASIQEQVDAAKANRLRPASSAPQPAREASTTRQATSRSNGHGRKNVLSTTAQQRAARSIATAKGLDLHTFLREFNCADVTQMSLSDCSALIDRLKATSGNGR